MERARAETKLIRPSGPLDLSALKGKTIWYVTVTFNQFSSDWVAGLKEAADLAGVRLVTFDGQGFVARFNEGISQAVAQKAAGIIVAAIEPSVISAALREAKEAGIPVLNGFNSDPDAPLPNGMFANFTSNFTADGETAVKWALLDSGCIADIVMLTSNSVVVWQNMVTGAEKAVRQYCKECKLEVKDVDIANIATSLAGQLQSSLQKDPGVGYIFATGDSLVPLILPIVATANSRAKVLGRDGVAASIEMIAKRSGQDMTLAMPDFKWLGWLASHDLARQILAQPRTGYSIPTRIIETANVGRGTQAELFPAYANFRDVFIATWAGR